MGQSCNEFNHDHLLSYCITNKHFDKHTLHMHVLVMLMCGLSFGRGTHSSAAPMGLPTKK